jgi:SsrA-binding protein
VTLLAENRVARQRYFILENFTAGVVLQGTEVKSAKEGKIQLRDAYVRVANGEAFLLNCHIAPYTHGNIVNHEPTRTRKLLLKRSEINKLIGRVEEKGLTLIPLKLFLTRGYVKVEVGLCKGKEEHDKRETIKKREMDREMRRAIRGRE